MPGEVIITCDRCGFTGEKELYRHIGNVMCCGPLVFKECPACGNKVICDRQEMQEEIREAAREVSIQLEDALEKRDVPLARELLDQLYCLNQALNMESIREYIRQVRKRIRALGDSPAAV